MAALSRWRARSAEVIQEVIRANPALKDEALRKAVLAAYPFGERAMLPYKMWLKTVAEILGPSPKAKAARAARQTALLAELNSRIGPAIPGIEENA